MIDVLTLDDARVAPYGSIRDPRALEAAGLFVAEGRLVVARLLEVAAGPGQWSGTVQSVLLSPAALEQMRPIVEAHPGVPTYVVRQDDMNTVVGFNIHRGCLALARRPRVPRLGEYPIGAARSIVALDGVNNPDNLGGIFRSSAAFNADVVALGPGCADPLYRKSVRTSMGAVLTVPWVAAEPWLDSLARLREAGCILAALTPAPDAVPLPEWSPGTRPVAMIAGAEGAGLSPATLEAADLHLRIPMTARVDSLNVHTALAIALYHLEVRRRERRD